MVDVEIISRSMVDQDSATLLLTPTKRDHVVPLVGGDGHCVCEGCVDYRTVEPTKRSNNQSTTGEDALRHKTLGHSPNFSDITPKVIQNAISSVPLTSSQRKTLI